MSPLTLCIVVVRFPVLRCDTTITYAGYIANLSPPLTPPCDNVDGKPTAIQYNIQKQQDRGTRLKLKGVGWGALIRARTLFEKYSMMDNHKNSQPCTSMIQPVLPHLVHGKTP
ncbi:hypothetical protein HOY80DRAFT_329636 [Tuber brumale]|nr:hypothetical protein HOY80DRAFT_329636 [Tuber brumale]